jgi:alkylhydroperoxidase/carboxymuconolactone decarboxylase family protein YurZ
MKDIIKNAPNVAEAFFHLTRTIKGYSPLDEKTNELILLGIFATHRGLRGLHTHVERAVAEGATKEEILASILLALPIVGITDIALAVEQAVITLEQMQGQEQREQVNGTAH